MGGRGRLEQSCPSRLKLFITHLVFGVVFLQGYVESASRVQNSKPDYNEITPSPEWTMSTNGWKPIIPASTGAPAKTEENMRPVEIPQRQQPKQRVTVNRFPDENHMFTLEGLSPPPIDILSDSDQTDDSKAQMRPRRQKKRPPFKTVDSPGIVSAGSEVLTYHTNSESPFLRHYPDVPEAQFRHRPIETNTGAVYRAVNSQPSDSPFRSDPAPSQEMLPPTASSRPFPSPTDGQNFHLRPQQPTYHGSYFFFHGQPQQQHFPTVARPSDPLPGSILRPHGERTPLTDSSAFRSGGAGFHHRPAPVQWPNPLADGRPSYSVTNTPLVEDRPWPASVHNGERRPEATGTTTFPLGGAQALRGSNQGKLQKEVLLGGSGTATVVAPGGPKNPFPSAQNSKGRGKPQREQTHPQFHVLNAADQLGIIPSGHVPKQQSPIRPSSRDPNFGLRPSKTPEVEVGSPGVRSSKKPSRANNDGKIFNQGLDDVGSEETVRHREKPRPEAIAPEFPQEERPRLSRPSKFRQNPNHRKKPEEADKAETSSDGMLEPTDHFTPTPKEEERVIPTDDGINGQRETIPGHGTGIRKRRPKPTAQGQEIHSTSPLEAQDVYQQQQEVQQQQVYQQQPDVNVRQRKRPRRPTRVRKPVKEPLNEGTFQRGENYLLPTGQAVAQVEEQTQRQKYMEPRPRPILRTRRPRPDISPSPLPIQNSATAPADTGPIEDDLPFDRPKKVRPTIRNENKGIFKENSRENDATLSSETPESTVAPYSQAQEVKNSETQHILKENGPIFEENEKAEGTESSRHHIDGSDSLVRGDHVKGIDGATEKTDIVKDVTEEEEQEVKLIETSTVPINAVTREISTVLTTSEAPVLATTEFQTTTVAPTSSAYGIRSRLRAGSRPRFSVKDYRERLNRLSQLSGRGRNTTETEDSATTGAGIGPTAKERWYPGRRQQQTLQEQQQLQHQRLQATNEGDATDEKPKSEGSRYRPRAPALRPRPTSELKKNEEPVSSTRGRKDEASIPNTSRYRSRFGGRFSTTTQSASDTDVTTTENPTSRRRGILTTYGMRRPYPLKSRLGATTTEAVDVQTPHETTPISVSSEVTTITVTTEIPTTTTTISEITTTTEEISVPKIVENEVMEQKNEDHMSNDDDAIAPSTEVEEVMELKDSFLHQDELINVGEGVSLSVSEEDNQEEDAISPAQRVSDLTLWATTGNSEGLRTNGSTGGGLVTFSAVSYPSAQFSSRLVTMATEDPVLPLEAFFFGPSASSGHSEK